MLARKRGPWTDMAAREAMRRRVTLAWHRPEVREPARERMRVGAYERHAREKGFMADWRIRVKGSVAGSEWELTGLTVAGKEYSVDPAAACRVIDVRVDLFPRLPAYVVATVQDDRLKQLTSQPGDTVAIS